MQIKQLKCAICQQEYSQKKLPRLLPKCGHSYCQYCIHELFSIIDNNIIITCPLDQVFMIVPSKNIEYLPKNINLIELIESKKRVKTKLEDLTKKQQNLQSQKPLNQKIQLKRNIDINYTQQRSKKKICKIHNKQQQIICLNDYLHICTSCAIFGDHRNHQLCSNKELQLKIKNKYLDLKQLQEKQKQLEQKIWGKNTKNKYAEKLMVKKKQIQEKIIQKFKYIVQLIINQKQKCLQKVKIVFNCIQQKYNQQLSKIKQQYIQYQQWKSKFNLMFQNFQQDYIHKQYLKCIQLIHKQQNFFDSGKQIIVQLINLQKYIQNKSHTLKQSVKLNINSQIDIYIKQYINIYYDDHISFKYMNSKKSYQEIYDKILKQTSVPVIQNFFTNQEFLLDDTNNNTKTQRNSRQQPQTHLINFNSSKQLPFSKTVDLNKNQQKKQFLIKRPKLQTLKTQPMIDTSNSSICLQKSIIKKKPLKLKLPQKYEKIVDAIINNQIQAIDFTNAQLGDNIILQILNLITQKVKVIKLGRNKITDQGFLKMIPLLKNITTLNLSQNLLSDKTIDILKQNINKLNNLKNIILSQNKIKQRNVKNRIQDIKKYNLILTL